MNDNSPSLYESGCAAPPAPVILISFKSLSTLLRDGGEKASTPLFWEANNTAPSMRVEKNLAMLVEFEFGEDVGHQNV